MVDKVKIVSKRIQRVIEPESDLIGWRPNWQNPAEYPYTQDRAELAWELVRRSPDYASDRTLEQSLPFGVELKAVEYENLKFQNKKIVDRWKMQTLFHPATPFCPEIRRSFHSLYFYQPGAFVYPSMDEDKQSEIPVHLRAGDVVVKFNVKHDLKKQRAHAKHILESARANFEDQGGETIPFKKRPQLDAIPNYLRLLDAEHAGVSTREMADVIYGGIDPEASYSKAHKGLRKAGKFSDRGYIDLLKTEDPAKLGHL